MVPKFAIMERFTDLVGGVGVVAAAHATVTVGAAATGEVVGEGQIGTVNFHLRITAGNDPDRVGHQHAVSAAIARLRVGDAVDGVRRAGNVLTVDPPLIT